MAVQPALKFVIVQWTEQFPGTFSAEGPQTQAGYQYSWHTTTSVAASGVIQQRETFMENTEGNTSCHGAAAVTPRHPVIPKDFLHSLCCTTTWPLIETWLMPDLGQASCFNTNRQAGPVKSYLAVVCFRHNIVLCIIKNIMKIWAIHNQQVLE